MYLPPKPHSKHGQGCITASDHTYGYFERIDVSEFTGHLMQILHVLNQPDAEIKLTEDHVQEIKE